MWHSDLVYGNIIDLCAKVEYKSTRGSRVRPYSDLTNKILKHRKDFIKNVLETRVLRTEFPHNYDDSDLQLCTSNIIRENFVLFRSGLDKTEIINLLAKIICIQEVIPQRNHSTIESGEDKKTEDTIVVATLDMNYEVKANPTDNRSLVEAKHSRKDRLTYFEYIYCLNMYQQY